DAIGAPRRLHAELVADGVALSAAGEIAPREVAELTPRDPAGRVEPTVVAEARDVVKRFPGCAPRRPRRAVVAVRGRNLHRDRGALGEWEDDTAASACGPGPPDGRRRRRPRPGAWCALAGRGRGGASARDRARDPGAGARPA